MKNSHYLSTLLACLCLQLQQPVAAAEPTMTEVPLGSAIGLVGDFVTTELILNSPITAKITVRSVQTLADGNRIVNEDNTKLMRDSDGRVRREHGTNSSSPGGLISLADPGGKSAYMIDSAREVAIRLPEFGHTAAIGVATCAQGASCAMAEEFVPNGEAVSAGVIVDRGFVPIEEGGFFLPTSIPMVMGPPGHSGPLMMQLPENTEQQSLGEDFIDGHRVQGTVYTTIYAAQTFGNEKPMVTTKETWFSPELGMMLRSTESDPRAGTLDYAVEILSTEEPDAALFEIPEGFRIIGLPAPVYNSSTQQPGSE